MNCSQLVCFRLSAAEIAGRGGEVPDASPQAAAERLSCPTGILLGGWWECAAQVEERRHQDTSEEAACPASTAELLKVALLFFVQTTAAPG